MVLTVLLPVISGLMVLLFGAEIKAWLPSWAEMIRKRAIRALPAQLRERYDEKWAAFLNDIPGPISKLVSAAGFLWAARKIEARSFYRALVRRWCYTNASASSKFSRVVSNCMVWLIRDQKAPRFMRGQIFIFGLKWYLAGLLRSVRWSSRHIDHVDDLEERSALRDGFYKSCDSLHSSLENMKFALEKREEEAVAK